jgi:predicted anti-sigma-YlaC factor YlaD
MKHSSEDELLLYALEATVSSGEHDAIAAHLEVCSECRSRLEGIRKELEVLSSVRPKGRALEMPDSSLQGPDEWSHHAGTGHDRRSVRYGRTVLRAATFTVVGFLVGLGTSNWIHREPVLVSPAYVTLSPPAQSIAAHAACDATDISAQYYERLVQESK